MLFGFPTGVIMCDKDCVIGWYIEATLVSTSTNKVTNQLTTKIPYSFIAIFFKGINILPTNKTDTNKGIHGRGLGFSGYHVECS